MIYHDRYVQAIEWLDKAYPNRIYLDGYGSRAWDKDAHKFATAYASSTFDEVMVFNWAWGRLQWLLQNPDQTIGNPGERIARHIQGGS
jgi:hypothetical protein